MYNKKSVSLIKDLKSFSRGKSIYNPVFVKL